MVIVQEWSKVDRELQWLRSWGMVTMHENVRMKFGIFYNDGIGTKKMKLL